MTTENADTQQPLAEPVMQDEPAVAAPAPAADSPADAEMSGLGEVSAEDEPMAESALSAQDSDQTREEEGEASFSDKESLSQVDAAPLSVAEAEESAATDDVLTPAEEAPELPPPSPIQLVLWNEKVPASAGCWVFWREAGCECRGKIEKGLLTATCKGQGGSEKSQPVEILLRRRFVSQGEAIAVMGGMLSFDPHEAERFGFEIHGRAMLPLWPVSRPLDEEQPAVSG